MTDYTFPVKKRSESQIVINELRQKNSVLRLAYKKIAKKFKGVREPFRCRHPSTWVKELTGYIQWCSRCGSVRHLHLDTLKWLHWQPPVNQIVLKNGGRGPFRRKK